MCNYDVVVLYDFFQKQGEKIISVTYKIIWKSHDNSEFTIVS